MPRRPATTPPQGGPAIVEEASVGAVGSEALFAVPEPPDPAAEPYEDQRLWPPQRSCRVTWEDVSSVCVDAVNQRYFARARTGVVWGGKRLQLRQA